MGQMLWVWLLGAPVLVALIDLFTTGGSKTRHT